MSSDETDLLVAEYVLGTLDPEERNQLERRLDQETDLQAVLAKWERRLGALSDSVEEAAVSDGLWAGIEASIETPAQDPVTETAPAGFLTVRAEEGQWVALLDGVEKKLLFQDSAEGVEAFLIRIAPKTSLPEHGHKSIEECMVLEGDVLLAGQQLRAGDFQAAFPGVMHQDVYSESGCLLYVRGEIR